MSSKPYCNCLAKARGLDPGGRAHGFKNAIVVETPLPWRLDMMQKAGPLPQEVIDLLGVWLQEYKDGKGYSHLPLAIAPDPEYACPGFRRVMLYSRPAGLMSQFDKVEYLVPENECGPLIWSLYQDRERLVNYEPYRLPEHEGTRDILICTHGAVDAACAKFGYPLYRYMRDNLSSAGLRVWRVTHFGGHVFAPTFIDMPTGHYWAYVEREQAKQIIERRGDVRPLCGHYRGWAGLDGGFMQALERQLWLEHGWDWFTFAKAGEIVNQERSADPRWAQACLRYMTPSDTAERSLESRVEISHRINTEHATALDEKLNYAQYQVARKEKYLDPAIQREL
ncbi:MAG: hypothetical protein OXI77_11125 [Chloroflexota bacterium]|nr:hypothetical protein [Chloroflexota bacterium]MDE2908708.1 hypothetical protein [Chloroflexota bacterium]